MDFTFNRVCDGYLIGNRSDGALLVSIVTPLNDDYELYDNGKCILDSTAEGGQVLIRLGNEETLGRELRTYAQTEKYVRHKLDGTEPESTKKILRNIAEDNQERRKRVSVAAGQRYTRRSGLLRGGPSTQTQSRHADGGAGRSDGLSRAKHVHQNGLSQARAPRTAPGNPSHSPQ